MDLTTEDWKNTDINVDSLWLFPSRDKSGKHRNVYHGNFIPQIPNQLIRRYTNPNEIVVDMFMGSGTALYECESLRRRFIGFDINQEIIDSVRNTMAGSTCPFVINNCDVTNRKMFDDRMKYSLSSISTDNQVDFFIAHPPYLDVVKFTELEEDLSHISDVGIFLDKFVDAIGNIYGYLRTGKYFAIVIGDVYKNSEVIPLGFYVMYAIKKHFDVKLKGTIIKNIEGNKGKLGMQNIWKYRALKSDYYLFKHEYIFVFKKMK